MKKIVFLTFIAMFLSAGTYTNNLVKCMVKNSTPNDIKTLKTWMFFAFAQDKDLNRYAKITNSQKIAVNKKMGEYVNRLLLKKCPKELKAAIKNDGPQAIPVAFEYLGHVAGSAITSEPNVRRYFMEFSKYLNMKDINSLLTK